MSMPSLLNTTKHKELHLILGQYADINMQEDLKILYLKRSLNFPFN